jgi:sugar phosphate isomerase/epimerase
VTSSRNDLKYRMGTGPGGPNIEDGITWAGQNDFHFLDFNADHGANALATWTDERVRAVRALCEANDVRLGIHTLSGVNVAEFSPYMYEAVDAYIQAFVDLGRRLSVDHVITHAGLHQSSELEQRHKASMEHLERAAAYAEKVGVTLLLENLNYEPDEAEVHYMGHSVEELKVYFDKIPASALKWGASVNHMHLLPGDFDSFFDALGVDRIGLILVCDNRGRYEEHLLPGQGTMDFARLFRRLEGDGYRGPYMLTFGKTRDEKLAGREYLLKQAEL